MQTRLIMVGILLASQVSHAEDRYSQDDAAEQFRYEAKPQSSWQFSDQADQSPQGISPPGVYPANPATGSAKPLPSSPTTAPESKPSQLLESLAKRSPTSQLTGTPLTLNEALQGAQSRDQQSHRIQLYWKLAFAVTEYDLALRELTELSALQQSVLQPGRTWEEAQGVLQTTIETRQLTAKALQYQLQRELGRVGDRALPLPSDLPYCGAYNTRYTEIFADRQEPEAAELHELIATECDGLRQQAAAVTAARQWLDMVSKQRSSQSDGAELLQAFQSFARSRLLFLQTVSDYNSNIARYCELVVPQQVETRRLVAMHIQTRSLEWKREGIRRTSAEEPVQQRSSHRQLPRTYAEPDRNEPERVSNPEREGEHSIVVE
ncbi:MAG: hypothetical protein MI725_03095 [Pirellulales bacterium]|nr:hypothetical protein [Pirellulales bacterium]